MANKISRTTLGPVQATWVDSVIGLSILAVFVLGTPELFRRNPSWWPDLVNYLGHGDDRMAYFWGTNLWHGILFVAYNSVLGVLYWLGHPSVEKYKTEAEPWPWTSSDPSVRSQFWSLVWYSLGIVLFNNLALSCTLTYLTFPSAQAKGAFSFGVDDFPSTFTIVWQLAFCVLVEDFLFYWSHRFLHIPFLFKHIHKIHHKHHSPIGIASECAHPVEFYFGNMLPFTTGALLARSHAFTFWMWMAWRLGKTAEAHSGYSFPFSPFQILPFANPASAHDYHHNRGINSCYGSFLGIWDTLMGTNSDYLKHSKKMV